MDTWKKFMEATGKVFTKETGKELRRNREVNGKEFMEELGSQNK